MIQLLKEILLIKYSPEVSASAKHDCQTQGNSVQNGSDNGTQYFNQCIKDELGNWLPNSNE